jgi:hypothetical protein
VEQKSKRSAVEVLKVLKMWELELLCPESAKSGILYSLPTQSLKEELGRILEYAERVE